MGTCKNNQGFCIKKLHMDNQNDDDNDYDNDNHDPINDKNFRTLAIIM